MTLPMTRPYQHRKTGVYWLRKAVPDVLRARVGKRELVRSLGTKDPREARAKAPLVLAQFDAILASARAERPRVTLRDVTALAGEWYRAELAAWSADPDQFGDLDVYSGLLSDQVEEPDAADPSDDVVVRLTPTDLSDATRLLADHHYPADPDAVVRLARAVFAMRFKLVAALQRKLGGDWGPDLTLAAFPPLEPRKALEAVLKVTFSDLVSGWAGEAGTKGKALYDRECTARSLATFLGHDDAAGVTTEDVVRWKEARLKAGRTTKTVINDIGELRPIWSWARRNRKLTFAENPFAGVAPRSKKQGGMRPRGPFTEDEARKVLEAARRESDASLRWLPWACCFIGARIGELCQSTREDVRREGGGPWFLYIHDQGPERTLKTPHSERQVPLHPALVAEGFLRHVHDLPAGSPLFPDLRPDGFGSLGGTATKKHGRWVRRTVGIVDPSKDPAHAWRHRFEDQARRAGVPQNVTDALLGHLNAMNEGEGYGRGFRFMPDATVLWVAKMASPFALTG